MYGRSAIGKRSVQIMIAASRAGSEWIASLAAVLGHMVSNDAEKIDECRQEMHAIFQTL